MEVRKRTNVGLWHGQNLKIVEFFSEKAYQQ